MRLNAVYLSFLANLEEPTARFLPTNFQSSRVTEFRTTTFAFFSLVTRCIRAGYIIQPFQQATHLHCLRPITTGGPSPRGTATGCGVSRSPAAAREATMRVFPHQGNGG